MQGVENSELVYAPVRETTLLHRGARKADSGSETPTAAGQHNIKLQEAPVRATTDKTPLLQRCACR